MRPPNTPSGWRPEGVLEGGLDGSAHGALTAVAARHGSTDLDGRHRGIRNVSRWMDRRLHGELARLVQGSALPSPATGVGRDAPPAVGLQHAVGDHAAAARALARMECSRSLPVMRFARIAPTSGCPSTSSAAGSTRTVPRSSCERDDTHANMNCQQFSTPMAAAASSHETTRDTITVASTDPSATVTTKSKAFSLASVRSPLLRSTAIRSAYNTNPVFTTRPT